MPNFHEGQLRRILDNKPPGELSQCASYNLKETKVNIAQKMEIITSFNASTLQQRGECSVLLNEASARPSPAQLPRVSFTGNCLCQSWKTVCPSPGRQCVPARLNNRGPLQARTATSKCRSGQVRIHHSWARAEEAHMGVLYLRILLLFLNKSFKNYYS